MTKRLILSILLCIACLQIKAQKSSYVITEDDDWYRLEYWKQIKAGSALDFSCMGLLDAPAGKYGWIKAVGGHFEFENLPGVEQRFYGINLCHTANYPSHSQTDDLLKRLAMLGYNSIRIHHHDNLWKDDSNKEKLDYLLSQAISMGFYITTDLYVSRKVPWRNIGVDQDGDVPSALYKGLVGCDDKAFEDWCNYTSDFLCHINKYTGVAYKDEPAICLISLVNENKISGAYRTEFFLKNEGFLSWWREFCEETQMEGADPEKPTKIWSDQYNAFSKWYQKKAFRRCSEFVHSLGCKALLTNDSNTMNAEGMGIASGFDYIDSHSYIDHPKFKKGWGLPSSLSNDNPILDNKPDLLFQEYAVGADIPQVITEWSFAGPSQYRGMGGLLVGAMSSFMGWDGLWRFTYAHSRDSFADDPQCKMPTVTYFDLARDPLAQASDRVAISLFLRRDAEPGNLDGKHLDEIGEGLKMDEKGTLKVATPRTCGVFTTGNSGNVVAGDLKVSVYETPATVYLISLDTNPISTSSRMLLSHLTDVQGKGTEYENDERKQLKRWGKGLLVHKGEARISIRLDNPQLYTVYELDTTGIRGRKLKTEVNGNCLTFTTSTVNAMDSGIIYFEIVSKKYRQ